MALLRTKKRVASAAEPVEKFQYEEERTPTIDRIILSYDDSEDKLNPDVINRHAGAVKRVIQQAIFTYHKEVSAAEADKYGRDYKLAQAEENLNSLFESVRRIDLPKNALEDLSTYFIETSLDFTKPTKPTTREAMAKVGVLIGNGKIAEAQIREIADCHTQAVKSSHSNGMTASKVLCADMAESMLGWYNISVDAQHIPSITSEVVRIAQENAKKAAVAGTAALVATSILAPTVANASTRSNSVEVSVSTTSQNQTEAPSALPVGNATQSAESTVIKPTVSVSKADVESPRATFVGASTETAPATSIKPSVSLDKNEEVPTAPVAPVGQNAATPEQTIAVKPSAVAVETETKATSGPVGQQTDTATSTLELPSDRVVVRDPEDMVDANGNAYMRETSFATPKIEETERLDPKTATPEQIAMKSVMDAIKVEGDVRTAASLMRVLFHDKSVQATKFEKGKPVYDTTNPDLAKHVNGLALTFEDLMASKGHADADYVNNSLTALAVLSASSHDQTILNSPDIQAALANVKRPDDDYKGKLFDQYLGKAKEALTANDGVFLRGFEDGKKAQIETMYAYALMANVSDEQQGNEIKAIQEAEAAEAARLAAEAAARSAEAANGQEKSAEDQAIQNLIDREGDPVSKRAYQIFQFILDRTDLNLAQAAGIVGNLMVESGSSLNPSQHQFDGGPGRGIAQWEGPRIISLREFAAARGTVWDDFYTQLEFLLLELPGRQNTLEVLKGKPNQYEAARAFMILFETPRVVLDAKSSGYWGIVDEEAADRSSRADGFVNAINGEAGAVNAAREEARIAAEKAAAEAIYNHGPSFEQAKQLGNDFFHGRDEWLDNMEAPGMRVQCTALVNYFTERYVNDSNQRGDGHIVAETFANEHTADYSLRGLADITPYTIFSVSGETWGHTGLILSTEADGSIIVVEANVRSGFYDGAHGKGLIAFDTIGNKERENKWEGQVNIQKWSSRDAWMGYWHSKGFYGEDFASPDDPRRIGDNFKRGYDE